MGNTRRVLQQVTDEILDWTAHEKPNSIRWVASHLVDGDDWSLLQGGQVLWTMPRGAVVRQFILNHSIHHRGHLCVYLRMNDIAVPGLYGPSADEEGSM